MRIDLLDYLKGVQFWVLLRCTLLSCLFNDYSVRQLGASAVLPILVPQVSVDMVRVRLDMIANLPSCDRILGAGGVTVL